MKQLAQPRTLGTFALLAVALLAAAVIALCAVAPAHAATAKNWKGLLSYSAVKGSVRVMPKDKTKSVVTAKIKGKKVEAFVAYSDSGKRLKTLNLKNAKYLQEVTINGLPKLAAVDVSKCSKLKKVAVTSNPKLTKLALGKHNKLTLLDCNMGNKQDSKYTVKS